MPTTFINIATIFAFLIASSDLVIQIQHLNKRKTSHDISILGAVLRFIGVNILLAKYAFVKDIYLILGQIFFNSLLGIYTYKIIQYRKRKR